MAFYGPTPEKLYNGTLISICVWGGGGVRERERKHTFMSVRLHMEARSRYWVSSFLTPYLVF